MTTRGFLWLFALAVFGCANQKAGQNKGGETSLSCSESSLEAAHVSIATQTLSQKFNGCFLNHLKLNKLNELNLRLCAFLVVRPSGSVSHVKVEGRGQELSNDLKWCLEQELWKMDYSKMQFDHPQKVRFPMSFEVRKKQ